MVELILGISSIEKPAPSGRKYFGRETFYCTPIVARASLLQRKRYQPSA